MEMGTQGKLVEMGYTALSYFSPYKAWKYYKELLVNQYLPEADLQRLQFKKLKSIIRHAFENVPFYQNKFKEAGISPEDIKELDDIQNIPFTTRKELDGALPNAVISEGFSWKNLIPIRTSGTSEGKPFQILMDRECLNRKYALLLRSYSYLGWHFGKRIMALWNNSHEDYKPLRERPILKKVIYTWIHQKRLLPPFYRDSGLTDKKCLDYYNRICAFRPHLIEADTFALYQIGRGFLERDLFPEGIEAISSAASPTTFSIRDKLGKMFHSPVYNNYGPHEMEGVACECSERRGLHQSLDSYVIEFIRNGKPAAMDEFAELVLTDLENFAMPLIRYKIGDHIQAGSYPCTCGRTLPLMHDVEGRTGDVIKTSRGIFTESCLQNFFEKFGLENQFQMIQKKADQIESRIVPSVALNSPLIEKIIKGLNDLLGPEIQVHVERVRAIPCEPSGKFRPVKSMILGMQGET